MREVPTLVEEKSNEKEEYFKFNLSKKFKYVLQGALFKLVRPVIYLQSCLTFNRLNYKR